MRLIGLAVCLAFGLILAPPIVAGAQQAEKVARLGFLGLFTPEFAAVNVAAVREGLIELGWREGQNINFEWRHASGRRDQLGLLAEELIQQKVDVIVAFGTDASFAAKRATSTVPVVMAGAADPVGTGLVASLARPGGNVTGVSLLMSDVIRQAAPASQGSADHGQDSAHRRHPGVWLGPSSAGSARRAQPAAPPGFPTISESAEPQSAVDSSAQGDRPAVLHGRPEVDDDSQLARDVARLSWKLRD